MPHFSGYLSCNPVFKSFATVPAGIDVEFDGVAQNSFEVMSRLMETKSAMQGYGIGYAGTPEAANISYDGPDVPFSTGLKNIPWGRAVLCRIEKTEESTDPDTGETVPAKIILSSVVDSEDNIINGVCYGTTIKDNSVQLDCGISIGDSFSPDDQSEALKLAVAVFANASMDEGTLVFNNGDTVVAISEGIDPSIFHSADWSFEIPEEIAIGEHKGIVITVRGNILCSPCNKVAPVHTSFWDAVTNLAPSVLIDGMNPASLFSD